MNSGSLPRSVFLGGSGLCGDDMLWLFVTPVFRVAVCFSTRWVCSAKNIAGSLFTTEFTFGIGAIFFSFLSSSGALGSVSMSSMAVSFTNREFCAGYC